MRQLNVDEWRASLILSVLGISNTASRILTGLLVDCPRVDCMLVHNVAAVIAGTATCLVPVLDRYELLLMYAVVFGVFIGQSVAYGDLVINTMKSSILRSFVIVGFFS